MNFLFKVFVLPIVRRIVRKRVDVKACRCQSDAPSQPALGGRDAGAERRSDNQLLTIPSFPKVANKLGRAGARFQGPIRAFNVKNAASYTDRVEQSSKLPFPLDGGDEIPPQDIKDAASFLVNNSSGDVVHFWDRQLRDLGARAQELAQDPAHIRENIEAEKLATIAKVHAPPLQELPSNREIGGSKWAERFVTGFPTLGSPGAPGVYPEVPNAPPPISRQQLFDTARSRFRRNKVSQEAHRSKLGSEAIEQAEKGWLDGPFPFGHEGMLLVDGKQTLAIPAYRFGVEQTSTLRAADDLKRSSTNEATAILTPINLSSWDHVAQICTFFRAEGETRPSAMAKAGRADAYKQLPMEELDELAAAITLKQPRKKKRFGFIPKTQLFGSAAAVLRYNCLSRVLASLACRYLNLPCVGYYDDFAIVAPKLVIDKALQAFTTLRDELFAILKKSKSEAGPNLELLGLAIHFEEGYEDAIATLELAPTRIEKLIKMARELKGKNQVALAEIQKDAGKLRFAQTMITGRSGRAAMRPIYELIAKGSGNMPQDMKDCLFWRELAFPNLAPRLIRSPSSQDTTYPIRIYSDATREGNLASITLFPTGSSRKPLLFASQADAELRRLASSTNKIYIYELYAAVAKVFATKGALKGTKLILSVDNEAACAALTKGAAKNRCALMLVYTLWYLAALLDFRLWAEREFHRR